MIRTILRTLVEYLDPPRVIHDHDTFHRVDLLEDDAWSLFLVGPKTKSWGFWDRVTGQYTEWREFLRRRQTPTVGKYREDDVRAIAAMRAWREG